jgi:N-carbamoyl-L-amino-acid hydrolase
MSRRDNDDLRVNGGRLWQRLMEMARIGATPRGGVCRVALTEEDRAGRDLFVRWCRDAGLEVSIDRMGNIFARRAGRDETLPPVLIGSHLDSQPTGGKFDGAYGVLAALEVVETLDDHGMETQAPVEVVSWTNEEGARFAPALIGSGVFAGVFDLEYALSREDKAGRSMEEELERIGYAGEVPVGRRPIGAALEAHIEQGPVLEAEGKTIGIVTGITGLRWYDIFILGEETHAGPAPMAFRRDPLAGALPLLRQIYELAAQHAPDGRTTIGDISTVPGVRNTVPGELRFTLDMRHPDAADLDEMDRSLREIVSGECSLVGLEGRVHEIWHMAPVACAPECVDAVRRAADRLGESAMEIVSGAGHDSLYTSRVAPTGMVFVPTPGGLSHNELEAADPEHLTAGCNVLLHAVLELANS